MFGFNSSFFVLFYVPVVTLPWSQAIIKSAQAAMLRKCVERAVASAGLTRAFATAPAADVSRALQGLRNKLEQGGTSSCSPACTETCGLQAEHKISKIVYSTALADAALSTPIILHFFPATHLASFNQVRTLGTSLLGSSFTRTTQSMLRATK